MRTREDIIEDYARGMVRGFLSDLILAEERNQLAFDVNAENGLIDAFKAYVAGESLFKKREAIA